MLVFLLFACAADGPSDAFDPADTDPAEPDDGWERITVQRTGFGSVVWDGTTGWAIGWDGAVVEIGDTWREAGGGGLGSVYDVEARDGAVWALTHDAISRWDGAAWSSVPLPAALPGEGDLAVRADGDVAVLRSSAACDDCEPAMWVNQLAIWDGTAWTVVSPPDAETSLAAVAEAADGTLVASGSSGRIAVWGGSDWAFEATGASTYLQDLVAGGSGVVAVGYDGSVVRGTSGSWSVESATGGTDGFRAVDVDAAGAVWALGRDGLWTDQGGGWASTALPEGSFWDVAAMGSGAVVGGEDLGPVGLIGDGTGLAEAWRQLSVVPEAMAVDAQGTAWIAGYSGGVGIWDAQGYSGLRTDDDWSVQAIDASGPEDVVLVGYELLAGWDGAAWDEVPLEDHLHLWDVSIAPDGAAFAVGNRTDGAEVDSPVFFRRAEAGWIEETAPIPTVASVLIGVYAFAQDDVYALSWHGATELLHWDGVAWTALTGDLGFPYMKLWGRSGADLYLGGGDRDGGDALVRWDGSGVTAVAGAPFAVDSLAGDADVLLVGGTEGYVDAYAPGTWAYEGGVWTEVFRDATRTFVGAGGGRHVVVAGYEGRRRTAP